MRTREAATCNTSHCTLRCTHDGICDNYQFGDHGAASCEFIIELRLLGEAPSVLYNSSVAALVLVVVLCWGRVPGATFTLWLASSVSRSSVVLYTAQHCTLHYTLHYTLDNSGVVRVPEVVEEAAQHIMQ